MSEYLPDAGRLPVMQTWYTDQDRVLIYKSWEAAQIEKIKNGENVWVPRNFDDGYQGRVWDYFSGEKYVGFVDDCGDGTYTVWRAQPGSKEPRCIGDVDDMESAVTLLIADWEVMNDDHR